ncbi:MAG TPA: PepSY-associated TM helix domain-containing protein [Thermoanaerobaculia bacterium]|nr:PepSY-associated TM helix domain-containing protein [Thermoanaerobaculia bacterium]
MRKLLLTLHLYGTLIAGIFVVILGLTGSILAFESQLDRLFNPSLFDIAPQPAAPLPLPRLAAAVRQRFPSSSVEGFILPQHPDSAHIVYINSGAAVFVNGYTGAILGTRRGPTLLTRIHQIHTHLLAGKIGEMIMAVAAIVMLFLVVSGVILWWKYRKVTIKWNASLFRVMFDVHNAAGILSAIFLLLLSLTAIAIAFDNPIARWSYKATGTKPIPRSIPSTQRSGAATVDPDEVLRIAKAAEPGAAPLAIDYPEDTKDSYTVRMRFPEDRTPGGRSWVCVDQYSGKVLVAQSSRTAPLPVRAELMNRQIHTGDVFGTPSRIVMSASSLLVVLQAFSGVVMWWKRRK